MQYTTLPIILIVMIIIRTSGSLGFRMSLVLEEFFNKVLNSKMMNLSFVILDGL